MTYASRTAMGMTTPTALSWACMLCMLLASSAVLADDSLHILNRWKPNQALHVEGGGISSGEFQPEWRSARWWIDPVPGADAYVRLRNRDSWQYLHAERRHLEMGEIQPGWWSAMWIIEPVQGAEFVRLRNRWLQTYLHVEQGRLELGEIRPGWWSAQWRLQPATDVRPAGPGTERSDERPRSAPQFSGKTTADHQLRQDVYFHVALAFESSFNCPIERVHMAVDEVEHDGAGNVRYAEETWTVRGCGRSESYGVQLNPARRGGVDISVKVRQ